MYADNTGLLWSGRTFNRPIGNAGEIIYFFKHDNPTLSKCFCLASVFKYLFPYLLTIVLTVSVSLENTQLTLKVSCSQGWVRGQHVRSQGQGQGQQSSRPRPRPVLLEAKANAKSSIFDAKAKASNHDC